MKTLKGIAQDIKGLVSGEKTTYHAVAQDAEFEDLFQRYKDLPDWIAQVAYITFVLHIDVHTLRVNRK